MRVADDGAGRDGPPGQQRRLLQLKPWAPTDTRVQPARACISAQRARARGHMPWDGEFTIRSCFGIGEPVRSSRTRASMKKHGPIMQLLMKVPLHYKSPKFIKVDEPPVSSMHARIQ